LAAFRRSGATPSLDPLDDRAHCGASVRRVVPPGEVTVVAAPPPAETSWPGFVGFVGFGGFGGF
jgi:hypothetical protein